MARGKSPLEFPLDSWINFPFWNIIVIIISYRVQTQNMNT